MVELKTKRLLLRPLNFCEFEAVHSYASVWENIKYMSFPPNYKEATIKFLEECAKGWKDDPQQKYDFAITLEGRLIGACGIYLNDAKYEGMIGYLLHRDFWKQGFMAEAVEALINFSFKVLKLHGVYAY